MERDRCRCVIFIMTARLSSQRFDYCLCAAIPCKLANGPDGDGCYWRRMRNEGAASPVA